MNANLKCILCVEDEPEMIDLMRLILGRRGFEVKGATGGIEGLNMIRQEPPDLILLDLMMPDMDGYEVTRRLRQNPSTLQTPILMFTAKTQLDDKVIGFEVGANDYLTKPTHPSELQARVKTLLARVNNKKSVTGSLKDLNRGYVIGVLGARGGLGTTTMAVNLGAGLQARTKADVIVAEMLPGQGALALGATRWQMVRHHVLPGAMPGIMTGMILAVSRAAGETAALIMIGAFTFIAYDNTSPFEDFTTVPVQIYNWTIRPQEAFRQNAAAAIIVLMVFILTMNLLAAIIRERFRQQLGAGRKG